MLCGPAAATITEAAAATITTAATAAATISIAATAAATASITATAAALLHRFQTGLKQACSARTATRDVICSNPFPRRFVFPLSLVL